tara:strand:+ start:5004 stop:5684 length:681 start_codon:yes stop_codon:yes gene_type:complete
LSDRPDAKYLVYVGHLTHFGHANIIKYCNRPFLSPEEQRVPIDEWWHLGLSRETVERHDQTLINNWNRVVPIDGIVYHLGDIFLCSVERANAILDQLNGKIYLIKGNHEKTATSIPNRFEWIKNYFELRVRDPDGSRGSFNIQLFHYAILNFNKQHHGAWQLFGHSHTNANKWIEEHLPQSRILDVGVDGHDYTPWSYKEIKDFMLTKEGSTVDHHQSDKKESIKV